MYPIQTREKDMDPIADLLTTYAELNSSEVTELTEAPSALEYMRYVSKNRPFVVRRGVASWKASRLWSREYLKTAMKDQTVNVAVTPQGSVRQSDSLEDIPANLFAATLILHLRSKTAVSSLSSHGKRTSPLKTSLIMSLLKSLRRARGKFGMRKHVRNPLFPPPRD